MNLVLALVLTFFFLKDGPRFLPWLAAQTGPHAAPHVAELSYRSCGRCRSSSASRPWSA